MHSNSFKPEDILAAQDAAFSWGEETAKQPKADQSLESLLAQTSPHVAVVAQNISTLYGRDAALSLLAGTQQPENSERILAQIAEQDALFKKGHPDMRVEG